MSRILERSASERAGNTSNALSLPLQSHSTPAGYFPVLTSEQKGDSAGKHSKGSGTPVCSLQCYLERLSLPGTLDDDFRGSHLGTALEALVHEAPIVQFSSFLYYCYENEPEMVLEVMRIGNLSGSSSISFTTKEASAKPGTSYEHVQGTLYFAPGEDIMEIRIPLIMCDTWDPTLEFRVELGVGGMTNCILGRYLWVARVKVMKVRGDSFPSDRFSVNIMRRTLHEVSKPALFSEYCKSTLLIPKVRIGMWCMLIVGLLRNIHFISFLSMAVYVGMKLIDDSRSGIGFKYDEDFVFLWALSTLAFVPTLVFELLEYRLIGCKVDGTALRHLQQNVIQRFLNFTEYFRHDLRDGDLMLCCCQDAEVLVQQGFMNVMPLIQSVCKLVLLAIFQVSMPIACDKEVRPEVAIPLMSLPLIFVGFLLCTHRWTSRFLGKLSTSQVELGQIVDDTQGNYYLIADYNQRPFFVERNDQYMANYSKSRCNVNQITKINVSFLPLISLLLLSVYIPFGGKQVFDNELHLVFFLSDIFVCVSVGNICSQIHSRWMDIQKAFCSLERLVIFLNGKIDIPQRMQVNRRRRVITKELRARVRRELTEGRTLTNRGSILSAAMENQSSVSGTPIDGTKLVPPMVPNLLPVDLLPIRLSRIDLTKNKDLAIGTVRSKDTETSMVPFTYDFALDISQGQFVVLTGPPGEGKSSLLKVIGDTSVQDSGTDVFVPSHLRILHICSDALFFHGTLYANLTFGVSNDHPFTFYADGRRDRVMEICQRIGLPDSVLRLIRQDVQSRWNEVLSATHRTLLNIARALIANPELLCIHEPTDLFDHETSGMVLQLLKEFVMYKGIAQEDGSLHLRRPRTCIVTSNKKESALWADQVFYVSRDGIKKLSHEDDTCNVLLWPSEASKSSSLGCRPLVSLSKEYVGLYTSEGSGDAVVDTHSKHGIISSASNAKIDERCGTQPRNGHSDPLGVNTQGSFVSSKAIELLSQTPSLQSKVGEADLSQLGTTSSEESTELLLHGMVTESGQARQPSNDQVDKSKGFESQDTDGDKNL